MVAIGRPAQRAQHAHELRRLRWPGVGCKQRHHRQQQPADTPQLLANCQWAMNDATCVPEARPRVCVA